MADNTIDGLIKVQMDTAASIKQSDALAKKLDDLKKKADTVTTGIENAFKEMSSDLQKSIKASIKDDAFGKAKAKADIGRARISAVQEAKTIGYNAGKNLLTPDTGSNAVYGPNRPSHTERAINSAMRDRESRAARRQWELDNPIYGPAAPTAQQRIDNLGPIQGPRAPTTAERAEAVKAAQEEARLQRMVLHEREKLDKALAQNTKIRIAEEAAAIAKRGRDEKKAAEEVRKLKRQTEMEAGREAKKNQDEARRAARALKLDADAVSRVIDRTLGSSPDVQKRIAGILNAPGAQAARMGSGNSRMQAILNQLQAGGVNPAQATYFAGAGGRRPGGGGGGIGGAVGGFFQRNGGRIISSIGTGLGFGAGAFGIGAAINAGRAVIEATQTATAYGRQEIAASKLAGTQEKLNELMVAYTSASGGAVDKATTLSNVTRLLATGFAKSADDVERFVRATRGASIALGKDQDFVIQETQLAISNTSQKRLDQIGLGISEVTDEVERLRKANADWSRESAFQEAVISLMERKYGSLTKTLEGQGTGLERLRKAWADLYLEMGKGAKGPIDAAAGALANGLQQLSTISALQEKYRNDPNARPGFGASEEEKTIFKNAQQGRDNAEFFKNLEAGFDDFWDRLVLMYGGTPPNRTTAPNFTLRNPEDFGTSAPGGQLASRQSAFRSMNEERQAVTVAAYDAIEAVEKQAADSRLKEVESYEQQRESIIISYGKSMVREEEDFARGRARALRDYERSIVELMRGSAEREAEMAEDLNDNIDEIREDGNKRIKESEEDYAKEKVKREKDLRDQLLKAAGQLDAIAVLEARKAYKKQRTDQEEAHRERINDEKEAIEERISDAKEKYQEQLEDARKADAKRLEDMRVSRERQIADEDEDRALRLERAAEDHNDQLDELARQHGLRMTQIEEQAAEETAALEKALEMDLGALGYIIDGVSKKIKEREEAISDWFDMILNKFETDNQLPDNPFTSDTIPGETPVYRGSNARGNKSVVLQEGAVTINALPNMNIFELNELVKETLLEILEND